MLRFCAFLVLLLLAVSPAHAQKREVVIATQGPWKVDCTSEPQTGEKWCQVGTVFESNEPPYSLQFNYVRDTRMFFAMGAIRLVNVSFKVDGQAFTFDRCLGGICLMKGDPAAKALQAMRSGRELAIHFEGQSKLPPLLTVDLAAFEPMYKRVLSAPK